MGKGESVFEWTRRPSARRRRRGVTRLVVPSWIQPHLFRHRAAENTRVREWRGVRLTADKDLESDLAKLRERSRDLVQNNALAAGILNTLVFNVVGQGITPSPAPRAALLGITEEAAKAFREAAKDAWQEWAKVADATERTDFYGLQQLVERSALEAGDVFFHFVSIPDREDRPFELALELIEADRVTSQAGDEGWVMGVKRGAFGEPVAFRVFKSGDLWGTEDYQEIPRRNEAGLVMDQHFSRARVDQNRGIPVFAPVLELFDDLSSYLESEVVAARVAACIALVIKRTAAAEFAQGRTEETDDEGNQIESVEPGQTVYLEPGEEAQPFNPQRPTQTFESFVVQITRLICRGLDLPFELGALNFEKSNFSSGRMAALESRKVFRARQIALVQKFCQPAYEHCLEEAFLGGWFPMIPQGAWYALRSEWTRCDWVFPGWGWVDPEKEIGASVAAIQAGLSTLATECQQTTGKDWEDIQEQLAREEAKKKEIRGRGSSDDRPEDQAQGPA